MAERSNIFIAYCFPEKKWLDRVQAALDPIVGNGRCVVWDERKLKSGITWKTELPEVLATTKVAMMIVSDLFLESDFLTRAKLPALLERERANGLEICWVLASHCLFELAGLKEADAGNRTGAALDGLGSVQRDAEAAVIARKVIAFLGIEPTAATAQLVEKKPLLPSAIPANDPPKPVPKRRKNFGSKKAKDGLPPAPTPPEPVVPPAPSALVAIASTAPPKPAAVSPLAPAPPASVEKIAPIQTPAPLLTKALSLDTMIQTRQGTVLKLSRLATGLLFFACAMLFVSLAAAMFHSFTHFVFVAGFAVFAASLALWLHARARYLGQGLVAMRYTSSGLADDALPTRQRESLLRKADEYLAQN